MISFYKKILYAICKYAVPAIDGYAKLTVGYTMCLRTGNVTFMLEIGIALTNEDGKVLPEKFFCELYYLLQRNVGSSESEPGKINSMYLRINFIVKKCGKKIKGIYILIMIL